MDSISKISRIVSANIIIAHFLSPIWKVTTYEFRAYDSISVVYKNDIFGVIHIHMTPHLFISAFFIGRITFNPVDTHMWKNPKKSVKIQNLRQ